ncbi:TetR/AcrR family transcriptional regulator [Micromonospora sp. NPDC049523]|uniref:TetR/AcrR family transcriptional regulator n=1 Tax=Micromonospora sp. NPDC049523 TaxID=3155921 RepID=UPI0034267929
MPSRPTSGQRPPTFIEQARRTQLIDATIGLVARHGYAGTSLARIAEAAQISKATVLYHFPSKDAVVRAAYESVIEGLTAQVGTAVGTHTGAAALYAYIRSLVGHLHERPERARVIAEAILGDDEVTDRPGSAARWRAVADLVEAARIVGDYRADVDPRITAIMINGAIDAIVAERMADPAFDTPGAAEQLVTMLSRSLGTT